MPKPRKPSSAQAWAQGLGNKPSKFARGDTNQRKVFTSSGRLIRNTGPVLVTGGARGLQCLSLENYSAEEIMSHVDSLDAEYAKRYPGFVSKPWSEGEVRRLKESCKPSMMSDEMDKSPDSHLEKNDEIDKRIVESKGKNTASQKKTPQVEEKNDSLNKGKVESKGKSDTIQKKTPQVEEKIDNLSKGRVESEGKMLGERIEADHYGFQFVKPSKEQVTASDSTVSTTKDDKTEVISSIVNHIKARLASPDPARPHTTLILDGRFYVMHKDVKNDAIDDFVAEAVTFGDQKEAGFNPPEVEDEKWDMVIQKASTIAYEMMCNNNWVFSGKNPHPNAGRSKIFVVEMKCDLRTACCDGIARYMISAVKNPYAVAIIVYGMHYILHEDRKEEDIADFVWKFLNYNCMKKEDETEKRIFLESLMSFTDEVVEPVVVVRHGVSVSLDNSEIDAGSIFEVGQVYAKSNVEKDKEILSKGGPYIGGIDSNEPKEDKSNEVDEYEEVDGFDPRNIKCKCAIL